MKNDKLVFYLLLLAPFFAFPQAKNKIFKHRSAFELNETAIMLFQNFSYNQDSIKKSIGLLDEAISTDSAFFTAHINKVSMLCALGQNNEILKELDEAIKIYKRDPQLICMQAYILEKAGQPDIAMLKYREADTLYDNLIKSNQNFVYNKIGKAFLQLFLKSKKEGLRQFNEIARLYKEEKDVLLMKHAFYSFNKDEFIKNYCIPPQPLQAGPEISMYQIKK